MSSHLHEMPGGAAWSAPVRAGRLVTFTALGADANASVLLVGADRLDRLNIPDTLKSQVSACIRPPMVLMSDRGVGLASVVASSLDWHDCLTGLSHDAHLGRHGRSSYALDRNDWRRSARFGLISELTKHGLGEADLHGCVNLFTKVAIDERAALAWTPGWSQAGDTVTLRTETDVVLLVSTAPHALNPGTWAPAGVRIDVAPAEPVASDDPSLAFRAESARALEASRRAVA
jgi:uncharacterized protein